MQSVEQQPGPSNTQNNGKNFFTHVIDITRFIDIISFTDIQILPT